MKYSQLRAEVARLQRIAGEQNARAKRAEELVAGTLGYIPPNETAILACVAEVDPWMIEQLGPADLSSYLGHTQAMLLRRIVDTLAASEFVRVTQTPAIGGRLVEIMCELRVAKPLDGRSLAAALAKRANGGGP